MKKLDKKQLPQFAALCVLTAGVFGYFVLRLITPSPAAASTRPHSPAVTQTAPAVQADPKPASVSGAVTPVTDSTPAAADSATADSAAPAPTQGMRDPFVVGYVGPKTPPPSAPAASPAPVLPAPSKLSLPKIGPRMTSLPPASFSVPYAPPLPAASFPTRPGVTETAPPPAAAPSPPAWTVTGVLQSDGGQVAILRSGDSRRIVRLGDFVDNVYRVVDVTRASVVLRHGATFYLLMLGGAKAVPVKPVPGTPIPAIAWPKDSAIAPPRPARLALAQTGRALRKLSGRFLASAFTGPFPLAFGHSRDAQTADGAMRLLVDEQASAPASSDAPTVAER